MGLFDRLLGRKNNTTYIVSKLKQCKDADEQTRLINSLLDGPKFYVTFSHLADVERFLSQHIPYSGRAGTVTFVRPLSDGYILFTGGKISGDEALSVLRAIRVPGSGQKATVFYDWTPPNEMIAPLNEKVSPRAGTGLEEAPVLPLVQDDRAAQKPVVWEDPISDRLLSPAIAVGEKMATQEDPSASHNNQSQSKQNAKPNPLGCLLTAAITVGLSFFIGFLCALTASNRITSSGSDVIDFASRSGSVAGMALGVMTIVGPITYSLMSKLLPKETIPLDTTKSEAGDEKVPDSSVAAKTPAVEAAPVTIPPGTPQAVRKRGSGFILLLALIVCGIAGLVYWMQTTSQGVNLRSLFTFPSTSGPNSGNPGRAPVGCRLWNEISSADAGDMVCAYGLVQAAYMGDDITYIRFSEEQDTFRFVNLNKANFSDMIGKCIVAQGIVKTYGQMPYIEIGEQVELCE